jgi:hydrogenase maturation protease
MIELTHDILIIGIGNLLWADEGYGVRCVEAFDSTYATPPNVLVMDGGTQGLYLLPYVEAARKMVIFDAIDFGLPPGTLRVLQNGEVPAFMGAKKMSLHQTGFQEVLAAAQLVGRYPDELVLIGCQPVELDDYGGSLRDEVKAQVAPAVQLAHDWLAARGIVVTPREGKAGLRLNDTSLALDAYESGRPSEVEACRTGDPRFFSEET